MRTKQVGSKAATPGCVTKADASRKIVEKLIFDGTLAGRSYEELSAEVQKVLSDSHVSFKYVRDALFQGANDAGSEIALKFPVSDAEFTRLMRIISGLDGSLDTVAAPMVRYWAVTDEQRVMAGLEQHHSELCRNG